MPEHEHEIARRLLFLCLAPARPETETRSAAKKHHRGAPKPQIAGAHTEDWDALIQFSVRQGVAPLLAVRTRHVPMPVAFRERLETIYIANSVRNLRFAAEESRLSAALTGAGLRHWPLKGPGLSERLYADVGVRQISDLDLLIEPANLARTDALLAGLGYQRQTRGPISALSRAQELLYIREVPSSSSAPAGADPALPASSWEGVRPLSSPPATSHSSPATSFYLDLHQRLLPYVRRDALARSVFAEGMTNENLLLYLCANQITHRFARLRYVCDVTAFLEREGAAVNWDRLVRTARKMPWGPGVGLALDWAGELVPERVPPAVLKALRPNPLGDLLLRRALGADAAEAASRERTLDGPAGASVAVGAAFLGPAQLGMAWRVAFPSQAYLREQTGAPAGAPPFPAYASRVMRRIPAALRHLLKKTR
ncbi:MAG TPA: nucleotidyltransferase family protein [Candidatus Acidoferrales bacterium]|nr:nucleotidyltransferase family protein [Candidatus Acidoferrales bacterium]